MFNKIKFSRAGINALTSPFRWIIVTGIFYFIASGRIDILRAWIYIGVYIFGSLISGFILMKKAPELLNQRGKMQKGTEKKDKIVIITYFLFAIVITPVIAGLDYRFDIFSLPFNLLYLGIGLYVISAILSVWPMLHNPFFEGTVRIQKDRGHKIIESGPYSIVRHPGYLGMLIGSLPLPFAFGSVLSFVPVGIMISLVLIRTYYEDKTLRTELEGYKDYSQKVKYRLIPLLW
ncbi:MAG: isoprenylcysteine carboxylmethyltransferase family protein [Bacteroidota bacterium]|nr:isoprenylcysteine carboxylmethyltransferase family protein [Bacteroidota bacterium]